MTFTNKAFFRTSLIFTTALLLTACAAAQAAQPQTQTATLAKGTILATARANGAIQAEDESKLAFQTTGVVVDLKVRVGDAVKRGAVLASLDTADADLALRKAKAALQDATIARVIAQTNYSRTIDVARPADVAAARAALSAASANYDKVNAGPFRADHAAAQARLQNAQAALKRAQFGYDNAFRQDPASIGASPEALQLEQATNDVNAARAEIDRLLQPVNTADKNAAYRQIAEAKAQLDKVLQPARAYEVEKAQAEIAQAQNRIDQAALDVTQAERKLKQMQLVAPFDGVVSAVDVKVGEAAGSQPALTLMNMSALRIDINVDEVDVTHIRVGQDVSVRLDSLPGAELIGKVDSIAPTSKIVNGVVSYPVKVTVGQGTQPLKPGMTANTRIVLDKREGVMVAPNWAIRRDAKTGQAFVTVSVVPSGNATNAPSTKEIEVKLGLKDDSATEIVSGVSEGQMVVAPAAN